jgi:hypothetical protein
MRGGPNHTRGAKFRKRAVAQILDAIGRLIARYLEKPVRGYEPFTPGDPAALRRSLKPGDVLLVEAALGRSRGANDKIRLSQRIRPGKRYGRSLLPFLAASAGGRNSQPPARSPTSGSRRVFSLGGFPPHHWH